MASVPSLGAAPVVTLQERPIKIDQQERIFCKETGIKQLSQQDALARGPLPVFAKNVTLKAKNTYLSGSFLEMFNHLAYEWTKPTMPARVLEKLKQELAPALADDKAGGESNSSPSKRGEADVQLPSAWRQNYLYELIPEDAPCHLYFDIDGKVPEGGQRDVMERKQGALFRLCCEELRLQITPAQVEVSMYVLDASDARKFSRHLIFHVPGFAFANNRHCGAFVRYLCAKHAEQLDGAGIDVLVYTVNRLFRAAYCSKGADPGRVLRPHSVVTSAGSTRLDAPEPRSSLFHESLITNVFLFHRGNYVPRVQLLSYDSEFLSRCQSTAKMRKRERGTGAEGTGERTKRRRSKAAGTYFAIWGNTFLTRCQRDIEAAYAYRPKDFREQALLNTDDSSGHQTLIFQMVTGACSFRPGSPHGSDHSYAVVDLQRLKFRALCHSEKSPCVEGKTRSVWRDLSPAAQRTRKENVRDNHFISTHLPAALFSSE